MTTMYVGCAQVYDTCASEPQRTMTEAHLDYYENEINYIVSGLINGYQKFPGVSPYSLDLFNDALYWACAWARKNKPDEFYMYTVLSAGESAKKHLRADPYFTRPLFWTETTVSYDTLPFRKVQQSTDSLPSLESPTSAAVLDLCAGAADNAENRARRDNKQYERKHGLLPRGQSGKKGSRHR